MMVSSAKMYCLFCLICCLQLISENISATKNTMEMPPQKKFIWGEGKRKYITLLKGYQALVTPSSDRSSMKMNIL